MAEAKQQAGGDEPSMEEILQSIKKIISEDEPAKASEPAKVNGNGAHETVPGSDVLELTEMLPEEIPAAAAKIESAPAQSNDVLSAIDEALAVSAPATATSVSTPQVSVIDSTLLSDQAAIAASNAVKKLQNAAESPIPPLHTTPSPVMASGNTVEGMVLEMLKPMMKDWLDKNLPSIVERIVTIEIRKITK